MVSSTGRSVGAGLTVRPARWSRPQPSAYRPYFAGAQGLEALAGDGAVRKRGGEVGRRLLDGLVGETERAPVVAERTACPAQLQRFDRLLRVHVVVAHEPARLVGADRQEGRGEARMA